MPLRRLLPVVGVALLALVIPASPASATTPGAKRITYKFGPIDIKPGQNTIEFEGNRGFPKVPGYITRFKPDLVRVSDGSIPRVDVLHLHHAVWVINGYPQFAAGEEKTIVDLPKGYGWRSTPDDSWIMNHMIHNLYPAPDKVYVTYTIDFIPDTSPAAKRMKTIRTQWMDVEGGRAYPVFDVLKGTGRKGKFTYPTQEPNAYRGGRKRNEYTVQEDSTLIGTAAHLHPGGLYGDLWLKRGDRKVRLFRSRAKYYEPAGAVSWDVSMEATPKNWRVAVKKGDVLSVTGTYDSKRAAWYESMAIMPIAIQPNSTAGFDPFKDHAKIDVRGKVTHGHLAENRNHGGRRWSLPDARDLLDGPVTNGGTVNIKGFVYGQGDMVGRGAAPPPRPPVVGVGQSLTYFNEDAPRRIEHTITACRAPCNKTTGIAYPLADADVQFDSGQLGFGPPGRTAAAQRDTWETPKNLKAGTYTYFCRVHPFMRGSFRVKG